LPKRAKLSDFVGLPSLSASLRREEGVELAVLDPKHDDGDDRRDADNEFCSPLAKGARAFDRRVASHGQCENEAAQPKEVSRSRAHVQHRANGAARCWPGGCRLRIRQQPPRI
jgi:hypothetical protein